MIMTKMLIHKHIKELLVLKQENNIGNNKPNMFNGFSFLKQF